MINVVNTIDYNVSLPLRLMVKNYNAQIEELVFQHLAGNELLMLQWHTLTEGKDLIN